MNGIESRQDGGVEPKDMIPPFQPNGYLPAEFTKQPGNKRPNAWEPIRTEGRYYKACSKLWKT